MWTELNNRENHYLCDLMQRRLIFLTGLSPVLHSTSKTEQRHEFTHQFTLPVVLSKLHSALCFSVTFSNDVCYFFYRSGLQASCCVPVKQNVMVFKNDARQLSMFFAALHRGAAQWA